MGMPDDAAAAYRKALALDPASSAANYNLGSSLARSGAYAEAEKHYRAALKKSPNSQTYAGLGIVLSRQGRTDEAIANLKAAIEADPKNTVAQQELAQVLGSKRPAGD
jgi:Tfp pilus assembly protein PilF